MAPGAYETTEEGWVGYFKCVECDAESPYVIHCDSWEDAVKKAHRKATERTRIKPLTLPELEIICDTGEYETLWCDQASGVDEDNAFVYLSDVVDWIFANNGPAKYYGRTWRCWTRKPTNEERNAASWEI